MRDFVAIRGNAILTRTDNDRCWRPVVEIIVLTSEPQYHLDEDYDVKSRRHDLEQFRFATTEEGIGLMIQGLEKARFDLQSQQTAADNANTEWKKAA